MNQNAWIIGGGVVIVGFTIFLYMISGGSSASKTADAPVAVSSTTQATKEPDPVIETIPTTPVTEEATTSPVEKEAPSVSKEQSSLAVLHTSMGDITVKLYTKEVPKTSENFLKLARSGFYDGVRFHRVIKNFMIQSGDPLSKDDAKIDAWGSGGPGYKFADEIDASSALYQKGYKRGVLAMANSGPNTNGSQFFIMHQDVPLPPSYTIFGEVTSGIDIVDAIANVKTDGSANSGTGHDRPLTPVTITSVKVK